MQIRARPISLLLLAITLVVHCAVALLQLESSSAPYAGFREIFAFFVTLSALCSLPMLISPSLILFRLLLSLKVLSFAAAANGLGGRFHEVLPLLLPTMIEVAFYERPDLGRVVVVAVPLLAITYQVLNSSYGAPHAMDRRELYVSVVVLGPTAFVAPLLSSYRAALVRLSAERQKLTKAVSELSDMNLGYQALAINAREASTRDERFRLTRGLHDALGYSLTNIAMMMEAGSVTVEAEPSKAKEILSLTKQQALEGLTEVRKILYALRDREEAAPTGLRAVSRLISVFRAASQAEVRVDFGNSPNEWDAQTDAAVFHFVREALMNAIRHGNADHIRVGFTCHEGTLLVTVGDNGPGAPVVREGLGMTGMRERLGPLGGTLSYATTAAGFEIRAALPLKE